jgi:outer membrane murein-binding lipoprotein Lpp
MKERWFTSSVPMQWMACIAMLVLSGCGKLARIDECRSFASTVNPALERIETTVRKESAITLRQASTSYSALAETVRQQKFSPQGRHVFAEYSDLLAEVVPSLNAYADAVEKNQKQKQEAARGDLIRVKRREHALIKRIQSYCHGR